MCLWTKVGCEAPGDGGVTAAISGVLVEGGFFAAHDEVWYSPLRAALDAFMDSTQQTVTGTVRMKLHKGNCIPVGRKSPYSLYRLDLATYDTGDRFDQRASKGFIQIWGMSAQIAEIVKRETEG